MRTTFVLPRLSFRARLFALAALAGVTVVLPVAGAGCGRTACFVYSQAEHDAHGTCPAQQDALPFFSSASCPGLVVSVDGAGVFDLNDTRPADSLCCYPVTQQDVELADDRIDCLPTGVGGTFGGGTDFGAGGSFGVGGGFGECFTCEQLASGASPDLVCPESLDAWIALQGCACASSSTCASTCELNLCAGTPSTAECQGCLGGLDACDVPLADCMFH